MENYKHELAHRVYEASHLVRTDPPFTLRSGATSTEYFDKYLFESDSTLLADLCVVMWDDLLENETGFRYADFDYLAGLEMGGIPLAVVLGQQFDVPTVFVRKQSKGYGTDKFAEGPDIAGKKLVVVEDVVTSGGQIVTSTQMLREAGALVDVCIAVIDREAGGREALSAIGVELRALFTMSELKGTS